MHNVEEAICHILLSWMSLESLSSIIAFRIIPPCVSRHVIDWSGRLDSYDCTGCAILRRVRRAVLER